MFAKLFETSDHGQILVKIDTNEKHNPEVRVYFEPPNAGVCSVVFQQEDDSDESWDKTENLFLEFTEEKALIVVKECVLEMEGLL